MNPDSITPHQDLIAFLRSAKGPLAPLSFDQAVEASAAEAERRPQMGTDHSANQPPHDSPDALNPDASPASVEVQPVTNSPTSVTELGKTATCDTSNSAESTDPPSEPGNSGKNAAVERGVVADGQSPDANDTLAHSLRPYWIPPGLDLSTWPTKLAADVAGLINPLYLELVLAARSPMEQSVGSTIVYLHWLEILDQLEIGCGSLNNEFVRLERAMNGDPRPGLIERYLRVAGAKLRFSHFLLRLQEIKQRHKQSLTRRVGKTRRRRRRDESSDSEWSASGVRRGRTIAELAEEYDRRNSDSDR